VERLAERSVWPVRVVAVRVLAKSCSGVSLVDDQYAVEEFAADAANEVFGDGIGPWRPNRGLDDADDDGETAERVSS
jgi:hypothetical protein